MKKILLYSIVLLLLGCGKYEDGPKISLRSKKSRLAKTWVEVKRISVEETGNKSGKSQKSVKGPPSGSGGGTITMPAENFIEFTKDGSYYQYYDTLDSLLVGGSWVFDNKDENIIITADKKEIYLKILKLENEELWVVQDGEEIHFDSFEIFL